VKIIDLVCDGETLSTRTAPLPELPGGAALDPYVIDISDLFPMVFDFDSNSDAFIGMPPFQRTLFCANKDSKVMLADRFGCPLEVCADVRSFRMIDHHPMEHWHTARIFAGPRAEVCGHINWSTNETGALHGKVEKTYPKGGTQSGLLPGVIVEVFSQVVLFGITLLNCKNVHAREQPCDAKLAKRYEERHGHKRPRYYVLDIEPMRQKFRDANGGKDGISLAKALHICRGHFKNFDEKPLFGKLKGTYWWQPHVRGDAEAGVVDKDYRIKLEKP
jgi:hypothetical protein